MTGSPHVQQGCESGVQSELCDFRQIAYPLSPSDNEGVPHLQGCGEEILVNCGVTGMSSSNGTWRRSCPAVWSWGSNLILGRTGKGWISDSLNTRSNSLPWGRGEGGTGCPAAKGAEGAEH